MPEEAVTEETGEQTAQADPSSGEAVQEQPQGGISDAVLTRLDEIAARLPQAQKSADEGGETTEADPDLSEAEVEQILGELGYGDTEGEGEETEGFDQRAFTEGVIKAAQKVAEQAAQRSVQPAVESILERERDEAFAQLEEQYPRLVEPETMTAVLDRAEEMAKGLVGSLGERAYALLDEASFIETVYKGMQTDERAASETPAGEREVALEQGGGANPGPAEGEPTDDGARIVAAGNADPFGWLHGR